MRRCMEGGGRCLGKAGGRCMEGAWKVRGRCMEGSRHLLRDEAHVQTSVPRRAGAAVVPACIGEIIGRS